jgi:hypothetical protein
MNKTGILIKANSSAVSEVTPIEAKKGKFKLDELQGYVGGYIERLQVSWMGAPADMIVNEEGRLHGLPINRVASDVARTLIVGDVVLLRKGAW